MKTRYPTKEKILSKSVIFLEDEVEYIKTWKRTNWRTARRSADIRAKIYHISLLIQNIASLHDKKINVEYEPQRQTACYRPGNKTVYLINDSIISALHELAHAIYGRNELTACAWSVHLFKNIFPRAYAKLIWDRHTLRRKK